MKSGNVHIKVPKDAFLPCYHHLLKSIADIDFVWGGRDSGKSRNVAMLLILDCLRLPYFRCIMTRKVYNTIKGSQYQLIKDIVTEWKMDHLFTFIEGGCRIECINGNSFEGRGMDKPEKLKSFSNPSHCWAEEFSDFTLADFIIIISSLRYNQGRVKMWCTFNPEVDGEYTDHWLFKNFFDREDCYSNFTSTWTLGNDQLAQSVSSVPKFEPATTTGNLPDFQPSTKSVEQAITFSYQSTHTTYKDNRYCRPERRGILEQLAQLDPYYYQVYTLGRWGNRRVTDPFAFCYVPDKHKKPTQIIPKLELILSFDFNVNPITCGVYQHIGNKIRCHEAIQLANSDIYKLCTYISTKYRGFILLITGDATGRNTSALVQDGINYYTVIKNHFNLAPTQIKAPSVNPPIEENRVLVNACLHSMDIEIDPVNAKALHFDLTNVSVNEYGKIDKGDRTNKKKRADHLDHFRYYLNTFHRHILKQ